MSGVHGLGHTAAREDTGQDTSQAGRAIGRGGKEESVVSSEKSNLLVIELDEAVSLCLRVLWFFFLKTCKYICRGTKLSCQQKHLHTEEFSMKK